MIMYCNFGYRIPEDNCWEAGQLRGIGEPPHHKLISVISTLYRFHRKYQGSPSNAMLY